MNENYRACYEYGEKAELKFVNIAESKGMKVEKTTDSVDIHICNNSHCNDTTDRTWVAIKTMYGDNININQVDGWVSVNGTKIQLKGHREGKQR